jgi:hypothetical protein
MLFERVRKSSRGRLLTAVVAALLGATGSAAAQQDTSQVTPPAPNGATHTVKKGDTLWDLARQYLSDPFLWPEIYRLNTDVVEDPHWIYPGEQLKLPGAHDVQPVAEERPEPEPVVQPVPDSPRPAVGSTVFAQDGNRRFTGSRFGASPNLYPHTAVRPGEFYAAPWADRTDGPSAQGQLIASAEIPGIAQASERTHLMPQERVYLTLPGGIVAARGDRLLLFAKGPQVNDGARVMLPTGIVEVERADDGDATTARIVAQFGTIETGQGVVPLDRFTLGTESRPAPLLLGTEAKVVYVSDDVILPTVGFYVVLDATAKDGVKVGDQFTLFKPRRHVQLESNGRDVVLPEERIALAQVVKVTDRGATAVIVDQMHPAIALGTRARLTARMP